MTKGEKILVGAWAMNLIASAIVTVLKPNLLYAMVFMNVLLGLSSWSLYRWGYKVDRFNRYFAGGIARKMFLKYPGMLSKMQAWVAFLMAVFGNFMLYLR